MSRIHLTIGIICIVIIIAAGYFTGIIHTVEAVLFTLFIAAAGPLISMYVLKRVPKHDDR